MKIKNYLKYIIKKGIISFSFRVFKRLVPKKISNLTKKKIKRFINFFIKAINLKNYDESYFEKESPKKGIIFYLINSLRFIAKKIKVYLNKIKSKNYHLKNNKVKTFTDYDIEGKIKNFLNDPIRLNYKLRAITVVLKKNFKIKNSDVRVLIIFSRYLTEQGLHAKALSISRKIIALDPNNHFGYINAIENMLSLNPHKVNEETYLMLKKYFDQFSNSKRFLDTAIKVFSIRRQSIKSYNLLLKIIKKYPQNEELKIFKSSLENMTENEELDDLSSFKKEKNELETTKNWNYFHNKIKSYLISNEFEKAIFTLENYLINFHPIKIDYSEYTNFDEKADKLIKDALLLKLTPNLQSISLLYLYSNQYSELNPDLKKSIIRRGVNDSSFIWKACKLCKNSEDLKIIFDSLKKNGRVPIKYGRAYANAAQRAEEFDKAKKIYFSLINDALKNIKLKQMMKRLQKPSKSIGNSGTEALIDIVTLLNKNDIPHFAAAGTCLGIVREGKPLQHDQDIDIGIMDQDWDPKKLIEVIQNNDKFTTSIPHPKNKKIGAVHHSGVAIDFFRFYRESDKIWHNGVFVRWGNSPFKLENRNLNGISIRIPSGDDYLVENYGNWREPDPLFNAFLNGPNKEVIWPEYYSAHILSALNLSIRRGQFKKSISIMRDAIKGEFFNTSEKDKLIILFYKINKLNSSSQKL